jgi:alkaline phosphatase
MSNKPAKALINGAAALSALAAGAAWANPTVSIQPYDGARFGAGQKFDIRIEVTTTNNYRPTMTRFLLDHAPIIFTSGPNTAVDAPGYFGYNLRGYSTMRPGIHHIDAMVGDGYGRATASATFEVINPFGGNKNIRNVIVFLGDGMGAAHRSAARIVRYGETNGRYNDYLAMDKMPAVGLVNTGSLNSIVTDSAPGMATYVTGNKSFNNQEGVFPAHVKNAFYAPRVEYLSEYLHRIFGKSTGIVSTADVEDATPAANAVHTANRGAGQGICDQYFDDRGNTGLAVLLGGGRRWFLPSTTFGSSRGSGNDYSEMPADLTAAWNAAPGAVDPNRDLIADFTGAGFTYTPDRASLLANAGSATKLLGLFGYGNMNVSLDKINKRRGTDPNPTPVVDAYHAPDQPMLDEMTDAALQVLNKDPQGFYLMVEGAHIDKQSHAMDADRAIWEVIEFDRAIQKAVDFANGRHRGIRPNGSTLIIVTADHECSGFSIIGALSGGVNNLKNLPSDKTVLDPTVVPGRQKVVGEYDAAGFPKYTILSDGFPANSDIDGKLLIGFGASADRYEDWTTKPMPIIDSLLTSSIQGELSGAGYSSTPVGRTPESINGMFLRGQVPGTQAVHTATDVPLTAYSSQNTTAYSQFVGEQDNTDVFFKILRSVHGGY